MQDVESDQRWGASTISVPGGLPLAFKGGWGPDSDHGSGYLVRQKPIVGTGDRGWVFSMIAVPSDAAFATGTDMLSAIADWVARTVPLDASNPGRRLRPGLRLGLGKLAGFSPERLRSRRARCRREKAQKSEKSVVTGRGAGRELAPAGTNRPLAARQGGRAAGRCGRSRASLPSASRSASH